VKPEPMFTRFIRACDRPGEAEHILAAIPTVHLPKNQFAQPLRPPRIRTGMGSDATATTDRAIPALPVAKELP